MKLLRKYPFHARPEVIASLAAFCPACQREHGFIIVPYDDHPSWTFNGNYEKPTFTPSMLANKDGIDPDRPICHSHLTDGKWHFLADCTHGMAGQVVDMVSIED